MASPVYSTTYPVPPAVPMRPITPRMMSFAVTPAEPAVDADLHRLRPRLRQALRSQDVLHLRRANAEGQGPQGTVGAGMAVAADDGHPRLGQAQLRANDVDDPLLLAVQVVEGNAELLQFWARVSICWREMSSVTGSFRSQVGTLWSIVATVKSGRRTFRPARQGPRTPGGDHLVHQVQVDVEKGRLTRRLAYDVGIPDLLKQASSAGRSCLPHLTSRSTHAWWLLSGGLSTWKLAS